MDSRVRGSDGLKGSYGIGQARRTQSEKTCLLLKTLQLHTQKDLSCPYGPEGTVEPIWLFIRTLPLIAARVPRGLPSGGPFTLPPSPADIPVV